MMSEERLDRIERKLDALADGMIARFDHVDRRFDGMEKYLKSIEKTQGHVNSELSDQVADHEQRLTAIEKKI
jgi:tetrahydromethanopterin S-methyltransferase subunit G